MGIYDPSESKSSFVFKLCLLSFWLFLLWTWKILPNWWVWIIMSDIRRISAQEDLNFQINCVTVEDTAAYMNAQRWIWGWALAAQAHPQHNLSRQFSRKHCFEGQLSRTGPNLPWNVVSNQTLRNIIGCLLPLMKVHDPPLWTVFAMHLWTYMLPYSYIFVESYRHSQYRLHYSHTDRDNDHQWHHYLLHLMVQRHIYH